MDSPKGYEHLTLEEQFRVQTEIVENEKRLKKLTREQLIQVIGFQTKELMVAIKLNSELCSMNSLLLEDNELLKETLITLRDLIKQA